MNKATVRGVSVVERAKTDSAGTLPYGLRELAPTPSPRIFSGTLTMAQGQFFLQAVDGRYVLDAHSSFVSDRRLHDRKVSILGYLTEQIPASQVGTAPITAMKLVSHEAVSRRAYEIHESCRGGSAVENWLRAQWELLDH